MNQRLFVAIAIVGGILRCAASNAATIAFFDNSQLATNVASGVTSDTVSSNGYEFTLTRDKLFTGGVGMTEPIGRAVRVPWPAGVEAQAVTTPPPGVTNHKARIALRRVDGGAFNLTAFTAKLLANTSGAGADIEIMPSFHGEDGFNDPLYFRASGSYGMSFSYDESPSYLGSTALLKGFDVYRISLYVDFALTALTLQTAGGLPGDFDVDSDVDGADFMMWQRGESPNGAGAADLADWAANFGAVAVSSPVARGIPEPAPGAMLPAVVVAGGSLARRRRVGKQGL